MKVFIVGATGYVSSSIARLLLSNGWQVSGLARDAEKARLPLVGDIADLDALVAFAAQADATVFAPAIPFDDERVTIAQLLDRLAGSGKTFIFTSGTAVLSIDTPAGDWREESFAENDPWLPIDRMLVRVQTEELLFAAAARGIRAMVIRPPLIWGNGGSRQIPALFASVRATGHVCYVGRGLNCYSNVHVEDLALVYKLAIERGSAGAVHHAVAGEVNFRTIAEAVGEVAGSKAQSVDIGEACRIWGERNALMYFGVSSRSRAPRTRAELGWTPRHLDLEDIRNGSYRVAFGIGA